MTILWGKPTRLQLRRTAGFNLQVHSLETNGLGAVNCARPGHLGNPFVLDDPREACARFEEALVKNGSYINLHGRRIDAGFVRSMMRGLNGACFCPIDAPCCHVDTLIKVANS